MDTLLQVEGLWKKYSRDLNASLRYAAKDLIRNAVGGQIIDTELRDSEFWALREVNFTLKRGEVLAVLGHNGAGKSTLLKCIAGKLHADRGSVVRRGKLGHLLEMSAGFVPSMTGRENVSVRGQLMGKRGKELGLFISQVQEFAEIDEFFDAPVQFYSSGMKSRLGFAASSVISPDVLILDEVLAVGDLGFRMKCYSRVDELRRRCAVILVSHSMNHISRMATSALLLNKGAVVFHGSPQKGIDLYQKNMKSRKEKPACFKSERISFALTADGKDIFEEGSISFGAEISIKGSVYLNDTLTLAVVLYDQGGVAIAEWNSLRSAFKLRNGGVFNVELGSQNLCPGYYHIAILGFSCIGEVLFLSKPYNFKVTGHYLSSIHMQPIAKWYSGAKKE